MLIRESLTRPENNNLTVVRFVLASSVILTHCFEILHGIYPEDALVWPFGRPVSELAVDGFFFLSGFLVYNSLIRSTSAMAFMKRRIVRMWPGFAVSVLLTVAVGAYVSTTPMRQYFLGATGDFLFGNLTFLYGGYRLTGVMCDDVLCVINGSLWTLPWEVRCYIVLALLGVVGLAQRRWMVRFVLPATLIFALVWHLPAVQELAASTGRPGVLWVFKIWDRLWPLFALGTAAAIFRDRIPLNWGILLVLVVLHTVTQALGIKAFHVQSFMVGYAVLCFGFLTADKGSLSGRWPDYSFGMYIYAFPVMLILIFLGLKFDYLLLAAATMICTLPLAALSWHFVEKPAMDWAHRRREPKKISPQLS